MSIIQEIDFYRSIIDGARRFATEGHSSVETVQCKTFELDYATALHTQHWSGFGWGGHLSDDELEQLLSPLIPRADERFPGRACLLSAGLEECEHLLGGVR